jgi:hypothetical protein
MALLVARGVARAFDECSFYQTGEILPKIVQVQDNEGKIFSVTPVRVSEDLARVSQGLGLDYRTKKEDTEQSLSCFRGIELDPNFTRSQVFLINDGSTCVGVATLFAIPYKNLTREIYFKKNGGKLLAQPFSELFPVRPNSFVIETGWMQILPQYRHKKLGEAVLAHVLLPTIEKLCSQSKEEIVVKCSAAGCADKITRQRLFKVAHEFLLTDTKEIPISLAMEPTLGQVNPEALFTSNQSGVRLNRLSEVFNFSLGPVFAKVIANGGKR